MANRKRTKKTEKIAQAEWKNTKITFCQVDRENNLNFSFYFLKKEKESCAILSLILWKIKK